MADTSPPASDESVDASIVARWLLSILCVAIGFRLWLAYRYFGFFTGDDVEILEAGFRRSTGLAYQPWEIRNTLISELLVAPATGAAQLLGVQSTRALVWIATWPFVLFSVANIGLVFALARHWLRDRVTALAAAALYALHWLPVGLGSMVDPRTPSTSCVLAAALLVATAGNRSALRNLGGGALLAIAFAFRYSEVVFLVPLLLGAAWSSRGRRAGMRAVVTVLLGFGIGATLCVGAYDSATWESPFASLIAFAKYTLLERNSSSLVPHQPWYWYAWRLPQWMSPSLLPFVYVAAKRRDAARALAYVIAPLVALSFVHHKELRYLQGVVPFLVILSAFGATLMWRSGWRKTSAALILIYAGWSVAHLGFLRKNSMAAVLAAESLSRDPDLHVLAAAQAWAYGDRLILGNAVALIELPYPTSPADLRGIAARADHVALYEKSVRENPELEPTLRAEGFCGYARFASGESPAVLVYRPCPSAGRSE